MKDSSHTKFQTLTRHTIGRIPTIMTGASTYTPPPVWQWNKEAGSTSTNRPIAGATHEKELPVSEHSLQLYSMATPNGIEVTVMLKELLELGIAEAEYDAYLINIGNDDQFASGFVALNPNSTIPALADHSTSPPTRVIESASILHYLAERFGAFLPTEPRARTECLSWLFFQMRSAPYIGGGYGHFYACRDEKVEYYINCFAMETKRLLDVLNQRLAENRFLCGDEVHHRRMANHGWYGALVLHNLYDAGEFLDVASYTHVVRWARELEARPAVQLGRRVNRSWGAGRDRGAGASWFREFQVAQVVCIRIDASAPGNGANQRGAVETGRTLLVGRQVLSTNLD